VQEGGFREINGTWLGNNQNPFGNRWLNVKGWLGKFCIASSKEVYMARKTWAVPSGYAKTETGRWEPKDEECYQKGWIRRPGDYGTFVKNIAIPFAITRKVNVINSLGVRSEAKVPTGDVAAFGIEYVASDEATYKGIPCRMINRKRGIPLDLIEKGLIPPLVETRPLGKEGKNARKKRERRK